MLNFKQIIELMNCGDETYLYPAKTFNNVLLPAPDGPKIAVN